MHTTRRLDPRAAKRRDMARSILPSTARHISRKQLTQLRRTHRHLVTASLRPLRGATVAVPSSAPDTPAEDLPVTSPPDLRRPLAIDRLEPSIPEYPLHQHRELVFDRRCGDKVAPLLRWARHHAEGMEPNQARVTLRSVLPGGLIGRHAMSHLEYSVIQGRCSGVHGFDLTVTPPAETVLLVDLGRWALVHGRHGELNQRCRWAFGDRGRRYPAADLVVRPLLGGHDLITWATDIAKLAGNCQTVGKQVRWTHPFIGLGRLAPVGPWATSLGWSAPREALVAANTWDPMPDCML